MKHKYFKMLQNKLIKLLANSTSKIVKLFNKNQNNYNINYILFQMTNNKNKLIMMLIKLINIFKNIIKI